ncbi:hypothetical protein FQZ97_890500 [compost metagenome]
MVHRDRRRHRDALAAVPRMDAVVRLVEGDVAAGAVGQRRDRERLQRAAVQAGLHPRGIEQLAQHAAQRRVVEQRTRRLALRGPAQRQRRQPARARHAHAQHVGAVDVVGMDAVPQRAQALRGGLEIAGVDGQPGTVDRARRRAGDDAERQPAMGLAVARGDARQPAQHAGLVGRARAAAHHDQRGGGGGGAVRAICAVAWGGLVSWQGIAVHGGGAA